MAYNQELGGIIKSLIFEHLIQDDDLCKLLYYYPENYLDFNYNPISKPNLNDEQKKVLYTGDLYSEESNEWIGRRIYSTPKMPDAKTEQKCYVTLAFSGGHYPEENLGIRWHRLLIDIPCHVKQWEIKDDLRAYAVQGRICEVLSKPILDLGFQNQGLYFGNQMRDYSHYFYGPQIEFRFQLAYDENCGKLPKYQTRR